jgi:hypothetical protein
MSPSNNFSLLFSSGIVYSSTGAGSFSSFFIQVFCRELLFIGVFSCMMSFDWRY